ncbi:unnamed protein product [Brachionus calyciflorus]|uniref:Uncharacterized protein n=1 Tax=Brachionus calyciflorus TaxID=104777 RepID=A0A814DJ42_9BILA|nr:unnamed protein product [Brachionus calyciflorus]
MNQKTNFRIILLSILCVLIKTIYSQSSNEDSGEIFKDDTDASSEFKKYHKRLETIDGVEIASSYKEYLDLALGDLEDRLKKSNLKLADFKERIFKRTTLLKEIEREIEKRKEYSLQLSEKDKFLRTRLIRNTEMKSALQNLADIAGYKLNTIEKNQYLLESNSSENLNSILNEDETQVVNSRNLTNALVDKWEKSKNSSTYTRYIEMAYAEVDSILVADKQTLIDLIRKLKTNEYKLKELEQLRVKVNSSLTRLNELESSLSNLINHDLQISNTVKQLEKQMVQFNQDNMNNLQNLNNNNNNNSNNIQTKGE